MAVYGSHEKREARNGGAMIELAKNVFGLLGILAFCGMLYLFLGGVCVAVHGVAACTMERSDQ